MHGKAILSIAVDCVAVIMDHSIGQGLSGSFFVLSSEAREIEIPSFTSATASLRLAGVIRLRVPSSSSFPQRPQLDSSRCHRSYSAFATRGCVAVPWGPAAGESAANMTITPDRINMEVRPITLLILFLLRIGRILHQNRSLLLLNDI